MKGVTDNARHSMLGQVTFIFVSVQVLGYGGVFLLGPIILDNAPRVAPPAASSGSRPVKPNRLQVTHLQRYRPFLS